MEEEAEVQQVPRDPWVPLKTRKIDTAVYCGVCSMPIEYCEYSPSSEECKTWLQKTLPAEYNKKFGISTDELEEKTAELSLGDEGKKAEKKSSSKDKKKKGGPTKIVVKMAQKKGKKQVTLISGLENFNVDLKKAAKLFSNKFACGSSVTKDAAGVDEIAVQGEFLDKVVELIKKEYPHITDEHFQ